MPIRHLVGRQVAEDLGELGNGHSRDADPDENNDSLKHSEPDEGARDKAVCVCHVPLNLDSTDNGRDNARVHFKANMQNEVVSVALAYRGT